MSARIPVTPLPRVDRREVARHCLKPAAWPAADQLAWAAANTRGDLLDPGGQAARWSASMRLGASQAYGRWLTWLTREDRLDATVALALRVTPEAVDAYVGHLHDSVGSVTLATYLSHLYRALDVMSVGADWNWLHQLANSLSRVATPRDKRDRIVPSSELFQLGLDLMQRAEALCGPSPRERASLFRDGLLIALLAARPMRMANLKSIEIGRHLVRAGGGHWLLFPAAETKQRRPLEFSLPVVLEPQLERYLAVHRPALLAALPRRGSGDSADPVLPSSALWISNLGAPSGRLAIYTSVVKHTEARFGFPINPHLFRDCAATSIAVEDPENAAMIAAILGHTSLATAERHYIAARSIEAMRTYHRHVEHIRSQARRGKTPKK